MTKDNYLTIAAISLVAYLTADVAHHMLGHAAACLALGGQIKLLSSVFVNCSLTGSAIDLAGPFANLLTGLVSLVAIYLLPRMSSSTRLFLALVVAFNFFWFYLQLAFSVTTRTDDWAWFMKQFHISGLSRYGMIAAGLTGYVFSIRVVARQLAPFASPHARARIIVVIAWVSAGIIACATAAFDPRAADVILKSALPQSMLLSIGLLLVPTRAARLTSSADVATPLPLSVIWIVMAVLAGAASIVLLGPGTALSS
jgi:hypothetical protein